MDNASRCSHACVVPPTGYPGLVVFVTNRTNRIWQKWWYTSLLRIGYEWSHHFHLGPFLSLSLPPLPTPTSSLHPPLITLYLLWGNQLHVWTGPCDKELKLPASSQVNERGRESASTREAFSCLQPWANGMITAPSETLHSPLSS